MFNPNSEAFIPACLFIPQASSSGITLAVDVFSQFTHYRVKHTAHECWSCFGGVVLWGRWMNGFVVRGFFPGVQGQPDTWKIERRDSHMFQLSLSDPELFVYMLWWYNPNIAIKNLVLIFCPFLYKIVKKKKKKKIYVVSTLYFKSNMLF